MAYFTDKSSIYDSTYKLAVRHKVSLVSTDSKDGQDISMDIVGLSFFIDQPLFANYKKDQIGFWNILLATHLKSARIERDPFYNIIEAFAQLGIYAIVIQRLSGNSQTVFLLLPPYLGLYYGNYFRNDAFIGPAAYQSIIVADPNIDFRRFIEAYNKDNFPAEFETDGTRQKIFNLYTAFRSSAAENEISESMQAGYIGVVASEVASAEGSTLNWDVPNTLFYVAKTIYSMYVPNGFPAKKAYASKKVELSNLELIGKNGAKWPEPIIVIYSDPVNSNIPAFKTKKEAAFVKSEAIVNVDNLFLKKYIKSIRCTFSKCSTVDSEKAAGFIIHGDKQKRARRALSMKCGAPKEDVKNIQERLPNFANTYNGESETEFCKRLSDALKETLKIK